MRRQLIVHPQIMLNNTDWDVTRWTVFITHGFRGTIFNSWVQDLESTLLEIKDMNVVSCDWSQGSSGISYARAAVNSRVVGAEVLRLINYLIKNKLACVERIHLIGHSLGAHALSYVSASHIVARLTALEPAQLGFEEAHPETRVDAGDAQFVDVVHTNAAHFLTSLGMGIIKPIGDVDFFVNGGRKQPGCWLNKGLLNQVAAFYNAGVELIVGALGCSHQRAFVYYIEALKFSNCTFWGKQLTLSQNSDKEPCNIHNCQRLGRFTPHFPARGTFYITTDTHSPYCIPDPKTDFIMSYQQGSNVKTKFPFQDDSFGGI